MGSTLPKLTLTIVYSGSCIFFFPDKKERGRRERDRRKQMKRQMRRRREKEKVKRTV